MKTLIKKSVTPAKASLLSFVAAAIDLKSQSLIKGGGDDDDIIIIEDEVVG